MKLDKVIAVRASKTVYRDGDFAIKVFDEGYSKADILNEALNHARIEETNLNIPEVVEVTKVDSKWAIVTRFIEGKTLDMIMRENPEKSDEHMELFLAIQLSVHAQKAPLLNKLKDKYFRKIALTNLNATIKYDLNTLLESMPNHDKVVHGDFNPSNIIITEGGTPFILDWSHAAQGNASADAARTYLLFWLAGDQANGERYLDLFCQRSSTEKKYVQKWIPIVAACQSIIGKPEERELLLRWVDVADYQ